MAGYTRLFHSITEDILPTLTGAEIRVYLWLLRETLGRNRLENSIALRQFQAGTHIKSRSHLLEALRTLEAKSLLAVRRQFDTEGRAQTTIYRVVPQADWGPLGDLVPSADQVPLGYLVPAEDQVPPADQVPAVATVPQRSRPARRAEVPARYQPKKKKQEEAGPSPEEAAIWQQTQEKLRGEMSARNWELRLASVALVAHTGDVWSLQAPTHHQHIELVSQRWGRLIERALGTVVGHAVKLRFVPPQEGQAVG